MEVLLSVIPFILFLVLLLWIKLPLLPTSIITLLVVLGLLIGYWQILPLFLLTSIVKGVSMALEIFVIIAGAIFFLEVLTDIGIIDNIRFRLESFLKDYRVQVILLAWFFENFLEGTAGFGTPAVIVVPLLISLGIFPLTAVILALLGNSTAGVFGAAGTPIRVGFTGLDVSSVPLYAGLLNIVGILVPVFMLWVLTFPQKDKKQHFLEALPFAIWSGIVFIVPSILIIPLGQEFPSIIGSIIGLILVLITIRLGIFVPKNLRLLSETKIPEIKLSWIKIIAPYTLLILLLIIAKFTLGTSKLSNPGLMFILAGLPTALIWGRKQLVGNSFKKALSRGWEPFLVIASMSVMVQLIINSGNNSSTIPSLLKILAAGFQTPFLPFLAPFIGALGSFLTGSVTISNIMFGNLLNTASQIMHMESAKILALGLVGAAAGNMIALADILSAEAVAGLKNRTREVLRGVIIPCLIYIVLVGLIGLLIFQ